MLSLPFPLLHTVRVDWRSIFRKRFIFISVIYINHSALWSVRCHLQIKWFSFISNMSNKCHCDSYLHILVRYSKRLTIYPSCLCSRFDKSFREICHSLYLSGYILFQVGNALLFTLRFITWKAWELISIFIYSAIPIMTEFIYCICMILLFTAE